MPPPRPEAKSLAAAQGHILKKKESLLELEKYLEQPVVVTCQGDREVTGTLKGFDSNMNLVLGDSTETFGVNDVVPAAQRKLGATILRGGSVTCVVPANHFKPIPKPEAF
jgi:U6 snRNA-associated Sm-like protein LSm7